jgi:hypothetical protein
MKKLVQLLALLRMVPVQLGLRHSGWWAYFSRCASNITVRLRRARFSRLPISSAGQRPGDNLDPLLLDIRLAVDENTINEGIQFTILRCLGVTSIPEHLTEASTTDAQ